MNSAIYVYWDEPHSDEPPGWYHALVKEYHPDGELTIEYADKATEKLNLHSANLELTRKRQLAFIQSSRHPPKFPLKKAREEAKLLAKTCLSSPHTAKAFADDLSVFPRVLKTTNVSNQS